MIKIIIISIFLQCSLTNQAVGQYCDGTSINLTTNKITQLCYFETIKKPFPNTWSSKCAVSIKDGPDLYTVTIDYTKSKDSINVTISIGDERNHKFLVEKIMESMDFCSPMVKDNHFNDTLITVNGNYKILFSVLDIAKPYAKLNHFQCPDSVDVYYRINQVKKEVLDSHIQIARENIIEIERIKAIRRQDSLRVVAMHNDADEWQRDMKDYKDSLIDIFKQGIESDMKMLAITPDGILFKNVADSLLTAYNFDDSVLSEVETFVNYNFVCNPDSSIHEDEQSEPDINVAKGDSVWVSSKFLKSFKEKLFIKKFPVRMDTKDNYSEIARFYDKFKSIADSSDTAINKMIYLENTQAGKNIKQRKLTELESAKAELMKYSKVTVRHPTIYYYTLNFKLHQINVDWEAKRVDGTLSITDKSKYNPVTITDCLRQTFEKKIFNDKKKRYPLHIYQPSLNNKTSVFKQCILVQPQ